MRGPTRAPHQLRLLGSRFRLFPDAYVPRFRHQPEAKDQAHRRDEDRIEQRVPEATGCRECRRGDERHQPAAPAIADMIRHRYRGVTAMTFSVDRVGARVSGAMDFSRATPK